MWTYFILGFLLGVAAVTSAILAALEYDSATLPKAPMWEVFDKDGNLLR